jgi:hypothetical protein
VARSGTVVTVRGKVNQLSPDGEVVAQDVSARSRPIMRVTDGDRVVHESEVNTRGSVCAESSVLRKLARLKTGEVN